MKRFRYTPILLASTLLMLSASLVQAYTEIVPGDMNGDGFLTNQDLTLFTTCMAANPAAGPYFAPGCSVNGDERCDVMDYIFMIAMVSDGIADIEDGPYLDLDQLDCVGGCTAGVNAMLTIDGDVQCTNYVANLGVDGPGVAAAATWNSIFGGPLTLTVSVQNDTTGGASAAAGVSLTDVDPASSTMHLSLDVTCGGTPGTFDVLISMPNRSWLATDAGVDEKLLTITCQ